MGVVIAIIVTDLIHRPDDFEGCKVDIMDESGQVPDQEIGQLSRGSYKRQFGGFVQPDDNIILQCSVRGLSSAGALVFHGEGGS
ncbi:MAG: hypothetical protein ABI045_04450 [Flavobacteriales bacterium]